MRHRKKRNKLSRDAAHREALLSNLSKQLIEHERIQTSQAKAKAVKPEVEKLITLAKRGDLHARRQALSTLHNDKFIVHKLFDEVAPRYATRPGGYTRIVKLGPRRSDSHRDGVPRAGLSSGSFRLDIEYDGVRLLGLGRQPGMRTVQAELETALETILREPVR